MPYTPLYIALPIATAAGILGGYAAGGAMKLAIKYFGHEGFVAETSEQRAVRQYTEHAKQGMRE
jgi:hypothetical protein